MNYRKYTTCALSAAMLLSACSPAASSVNESTQTNENGNTKAEESSVQYEAGNTVNLTEQLEAGEISYSRLKDAEEAAAKDFAIELFKGSVRDDISNGENALISPESVYLALGMLANGATGETLQEMCNAMQSGGDLSSINNMAGNMLLGANASDKIKFNIANSVWLDNSERAFIPNKDCLQRIVDNYNADVFESKLVNAVNDVNDWCNKKTNGMIPKIVNEISDETRMILMNAIAFEAEWQETYEPEQIEEGMLFTAADGEKQEVNMMISTENIYLHDNDTVGVMKYYKGGRYAFMALLPDENMDIGEYVESLTEKKYSTLINNARMGEHIYVNTWIPEFTNDYEIHLNDVLQSMGMNGIYNDGEGLLGFLDESNLDHTIVVDDVFHKTHIEVDRAGTKAAAVTEIVMKDTCIALPEDNEYFDVHLDRPFVYFIVDCDNYMPVFAGVLNTTK